MCPFQTFKEILYFALFKVLMLFSKLTENSTKVFSKMVRQRNE